MAEEFQYIMASKKNKKTLFLKIHESKIEKVFNLLADNKYTIGQCAKWYYNAQLQEDHSEKEKNAEVIFIDSNSNIEEFIYEN